MKARVLLVDDEKEFLELLSERLTLRDYDVAISTSGEEALQKVKGYNYDVVILDVLMPGLSGIDTLREIKKMKPLTEVIMLTGNATVETGIEGMKLGALDYLMKPCDTEELVAKIHMAKERKYEHEERIREAKAKRIATSPWSVLRGE